MRKISSMNLGETRESSSPATAHQIWLDKTICKGTGQERRLFQVPVHEISRHHRGKTQSWCIRWTSDTTTVEWFSLHQYNAISRTECMECICSGGDQFSWQYQSWELQTPGGQPASSFPDAWVQHECESILFA